MKKLKQNILPLSLMALIPIINLYYKYINNASNGAHSLVTDIDRALPVVRLFVIPYVMWYPFIFIALTYYCFMDKYAYYKSLLSIISALPICFFIYILFQTTVPRPVLIENDICTRLINFVYNRDNPYNCFPSIHVLTTYIVFKGMTNCRSKGAIATVIITLMCIFIILSTQFIKQHVIMDAIFAIILGETIYKIMDLVVDRNSIWIRKLYLLWMAKRKLQV
jgi:hypothetical protein